MNPCAVLYMILMHYNGLVTARSATVVGLNKSEAFAFDTKRNDFWKKEKYNHEMAT